MDSLSEEVWDLVIAGTGLQQSLLALSLSRSGKKVLHLDRSEWYGGIDAGLSLNDVDTWIRDIEQGHSRRFSKPVIWQNNTNKPESVPGLGTSRSYTLALTPQIIHAKSALLPSLVSSKIAPQLEFVAVGSSWVLASDHLRKIPSTREDVFNDNSLSVRDKRSLMKFLRFVLQESEEPESPEVVKPGQTLEQLLDDFRIPSGLHSAVQALSLTTQSTSKSDAHVCVKNIRRYLTSIGHLGPGFGAVVAKYGSNPEIAQVACRAQAVGGGIYLLGHGIASKVESAPNEAADPGATNGPHDLTLSDGTAIRTARLVAGVDDLPRDTTTPSAHEDTIRTIHSISIISNPLRTLFTSGTENSPTPAAVMVLVEARDVEHANPIYLQVHSEDTGECPTGQSLIYASVEQDGSVSADDLFDAVQRVLSHVEHSAEDESTPIHVLWSLSFTSHGRRTQNAPPEASSLGLTVLEAPSFSPSADDEMLENVRVLWRDVLEGQVEDEQFLRFEERETEADDVDQG